MEERVIKDRIGQNSVVVSNMAINPGTFYARTPISHSSLVHPPVNCKQSNESELSNSEHQTSDQLDINSICSMGQPILQSSSCPSLDEKNQNQFGLVAPYNEGSFQQSLQTNWPAVQTMQQASSSIDNRLSQKFPYATANWFSPQTQNQFSSFNTNNLNQQISYDDWTPSRVSHQSESNFSGTLDRCILQDSLPSATFVPQHSTFNSDVSPFRTSMETSVHQQSINQSIKTF